MYKIFTFLVSLLFVACSPHTASIDSTMTSKGESSSMITLKKALDEYTEATVKNDVPKLIDFIYPKVFTVVSKAQMTKVLTSAYNSPNAPTVENVKHLKIEPIKSYKEGEYTIITSSMRTILKSPKPDDSKFEAYMLEVIKKGLEGKGSVTFNRENHTYAIQHVSRTLAIKEGKEWKFAGLKQAKKYAKKGLLAPTIVEAINQ